MGSPNKAPTIDAFAQAGIDAARSWLTAVEDLSKSLAKDNPFAVEINSSCCDIPPPCWMPRQFGDYHSQACPCGTALLRIRVTNCQPTQQEVRIAVDKERELGIKIVPEKAVLGPMQCKTFTVAVTIDDKACLGDIDKLIVWVSGCNDHYARWHIRVAEGTSGTCLDACIEDCPDYVHHWYDHFYCDRPCFSQRRER